MISLHHDRLTVDVLTESIAAKLRGQQLLLDLDVAPLRVRQSDRRVGDGLSILEKDGSKSSRGRIDRHNERLIRIEETEHWQSRKSLLQLLKISVLLCVPDPSRLAFEKIA